MTIELYLGSMDFYLCVMFRQIGDQIVINRDFWLKYGQFAKVLLLLEVKLERRIQCPNRIQWPNRFLIFKIFPRRNDPEPL
jgi:hypothetical protein